MDILGSLNFVLSIVIGLFLLVFLVVVHELGHAIVARRNGIVVEEFGIGFPPRAWAKKLKSGLLFSINWLPLGGFVKLQGENDAASKPGDYGAASFWVKTKVLLAGVAINWFVAVAIFTVLAVVGIPKVIPGQFEMPGDTVQTLQPVTIGAITKDSPAEKAGLQKGDELLRFDSQPITKPDDLYVATKSLKGQTVEVIYSRENKEAATKVTLNAVDTGNGFLGLGPQQNTVLRSTWSAPIVGVATTAQFSIATLQGLRDTVVTLAKGVFAQLNFDQNVRQEGSKEISNLSDGVAGPIGILGVIFPSAREAGIVSLLMITAIISLTLSIMNILPIPALDGGRFFLMSLYRIMKKPLTKETEEKINATGFLILMGLVVLVTFSDVRKLF